MKNNIKLILLSGIILIAFASSAQVYNINTFAGNGTGGYTGDGISAVTAEINDPEAVSVDTAGDVFITDYENNRIRMVNTLGIISTVAGNGTAGNTGNGGLATLAEINHPYGASVDSSGTLLIADGYNNCVRYVNSSGIISTVAGNGTAGYNGDGILATTAELNSPAAVAFDSIGDYFIADLSNNRVRMVTKKTGIISTVAGNGTAGYSGDGGAAVLAELNFISDVATDAKGNIYIDDFNNNCIRKVSTTGIITTIAGNGTAGYTGDGGPATSAELNFPAGMALDQYGNVYIADNDNNCIRKVDVSGTITTIAGNGTAGYSGDGGVATSAEINNPAGVAVDNSGNIYVADYGNNRIRILTPAPAAVNKVTVINKASIFPNPNNGKFTVNITSLKEQSAVELYNVLGEKVYTETLNAPNTQIDFTNNSPGVYIYKVLTDKGVMVSMGKLVIQ